MGKIKYWILWILIWETIALLYKDKELIKKLENKDWFDAIKIIFNDIVDLNKKLFFDVKTYDYDSKINEVKSIIDMEREKLEKKVDDIKDKANKLNNEQIHPLIEEFEEKAQDLMKYAKDTIHDLNERYHLENKIEIVKWKILELKNRLKK